MKIVWLLGLISVLLLVAYERVAGMPGELPQQPALAGTLPAPAVGVVRLSDEVEIQPAM